MLVLKQRIDYCAGRNLLTCPEARKTAEESLDYRLSHKDRVRAYRADGLLNDGVEVVVTGGTTQHVDVAITTLPLSPRHKL